MHGWWEPSFSVSEINGGCRLSLCGVASGEGETLQAAADDLVARLLGMSMSLRDRGWSSAFGMPDPNQLNFLWELGAIAARGEDIRDRLFGRASDRV
jgi:hypothetical protein